MGAPLPVSPQPSGLSVPRHLAIIMDGNGRWADARKLPRKLGHWQGSETLRNVIRVCPELGVEYLTVYAFSAENWNRSPEEVAHLMELLRYYLEKDFETMHQNNIRIRIIGDRSRLDQDIQTELEKLEAKTSGNTAMTFTVAISYGSRQEIVRAVREIAAKVKNGTLRPDAVDETSIFERLYTADLPDPDLLIRTGGEKRLSNFLLWQSAYAELYFSDVLWPDFTTDHLKAAIEDYGQRERRFGRRLAAG